MRNLVGAALGQGAPSLVQQAPGGDGDGFKAGIRTAQGLPAPSTLIFMGSISEGMEVPEQILHRLHRAQGWTPMSLPGWMTLDVNTFLQVHRGSGKGGLRTQRGQSPCSVFPAVPWDWW